ncbi:MAG: chromate transporter [Lachnospiraceae bacterium]|nr:chromate transporter [Lachnospiraceae bacterium]
MNEYMQLYTAFLRIGGLTFGGGLAMLPMLKYELVEKKNWITEEDLLDCYAIGQCTPGIIAVNTATYVGYKRKGVMGGIVATLGMITPSIVIITLVAICLQAFIENVWVQHALMGVRAVVCALMLNTVLTLAKKSLKNAFCYFVCIVAFLLAMFVPIPTVCIVIIAAVVGILVYAVGGKQV